MPISKQQLAELRRLRQKKYREQEQACLIEGIRLCEEAVRAEVGLVRACYLPEEMRNERSQTLLQELRRRGVPLEILTAPALAALTETTTPQGIVAVLRKTRMAEFDPQRCNEPLVLAIDGLADPGNLGTILRTAEWFGVRTLLLSRETVELYNPKVIRSSMGSLFRLRIHEGLDLLETARMARTAGWRLLTAEAGGGASARAITASGHDLLVIGSEAHGLRTPLHEVVDQRVTIPGGGAESLNAAIAAAILLYQLTTPPL
ncbi:MAG TPA: RNA methyltransferase [bacterium]|nr:RNA methyltransferase [bacterium]